MNIATDKCSGYLRTVIQLICCKTYGHQVLNLQLVLVKKKTVVIWHMECFN